MKVIERMLEKWIRCYFHHATSTRETPSKEAEAVLCCCGFREGI